MNIRLIYKSLALSALLVTATSCDELLDVTPQDKLTPSTFFRTAQDLQIYTNKFYGNNLPEGSIFQDRGDIVIPFTLDLAVSCQRYVTETSSQWSWGALRDINFYLQNSQNCNDASARTHYDGVARFFRALFYFDKVKNFGDVPWIEVAFASDSEGLYAGRDSRDFVLGKMMEDIDYAIASLPAQRDVYALTKWSALALKSRICLFEGTFRKYHGLNDAEKFLNLCVSASEELMKNGGYTIYRGTSTPYADLFRSLDAISDEIILARNYNGAQNIRHGAQGFVYSPGSAALGATQRVFKLYLMSDGSRFTDKTGWQTMEFKDETKNRDPRMAQTFCTPGFTRGSDKEIPNLRQCRLGYQQTKYVTDNKMYDANGSDVDLPLFRYAEVLLNYAEAKAELGTITQDDLDRSIKLIRERVGMKNLNLAQANANPDPVLESAELGFPNVNKGSNKGVILEIRRERTVEMVYEGLRFDDLLRWKEGAAINQPFRGMYFPGPGEYDLDNDGTPDIFLSDGTSSSSLPVQLKIGVDIHLEYGTKGCVIVHNGITRSWNETRDYYYYIPSKERVLNPALSQNPGWNDGLGI